MKSQDKIKVIRNGLLSTDSGRKISYDFFQCVKSTNAPLVILIHGFKGFKDWGHFNRVASYFSQNGFSFAKFNFSHNGIGDGDPETFDDLDGFGMNNFSKELDDLNHFIQFLCSSNFQFDRNNIGLIGHSRGGGIAILHGRKDRRVKQIVTWAAVSSFNRILTNLDLKQWKDSGIHYILNGRTNQRMPLGYQIIEDLESNTDKLNIIKAMEEMPIPVLLIHGSNDTVVLIDEAEQLRDASARSQLHIIKGAGHTFGAVHPYHNQLFENTIQELLDKTINFFINSKRN